VAESLRSSNDIRIKSRASHQINNILYSAEMSQLEAYSPFSTSSYFSPPTPAPYPNPPTPALYCNPPTQSSYSNTPTTDANIIQHTHPPSKQSSAVLTILPFSEHIPDW
jgi:hypothetical protein